MHPEQSPHVLELRHDLHEVFLAVAKRFRLHGMSKEEANDEAVVYVRGLFKKATLDIELEIERLSLRQLLHLLTRMRLSTLAGMGGFVASVFGAGVWVGQLIC